MDPPVRLVQEQQSGRNRLRLRSDPWVDSFPEITFDEIQDLELDPISLDSLHPPRRTLPNGSNLFR